MLASLLNYQVTDMKELLKQMAAYHTWAHQQLLDFILSLPEEKQVAEVISSFPSLFKTIIHVWDSESVWWQRVRMHERILVPSQNFNGTTKDAANGLLQQAKQWEDWVNSSSESLITHVIQYQNSKKEVLKQPIFQVLVHVFNHGTYHRGQIVTMLRELGVEKIPATDFSLWCRKSKVNSGSSSLAFL